MSASGAERASVCPSAGKYWHRHRRPRPVTYNSSLEYHQGLLRAEEQQKYAAKRKRPVASVVEDVKPQVDDDVEMDTPGPSAKPKSFVAETPSAAVDSATGGDALDRAISPVSTASSASESPLANRFKLNGAAHSKSAPPATAPEPEPAPEAPRAASPPRASPPRAAPSVPPPAQNSPVGVDDVSACGRIADPGAAADVDAAVAHGLDRGDEGPLS